MRVKFVGPQTARLLPVPGGQALRVKRGETVEVPDDLGKQLVEQSVWQESKAKPKAAAEEEEE